jgi:CheY-like chemotaxis protein
MPNKLLVFVVDDEQIMLDMLESVLEDSCSVETFVSAKDCLKRLEEQTPDLFLLDVTMPVMDGYAFCEKLKADANTSDIPVMFLSGHDDIDTRLRCYEVGADDFIRKPFTASELIKKIKVATRLIVEKRSLHHQAGYAQHTAMSGMTSMGELGVVLHFLRQSFACNTMDDLGQQLLAAMQQYDLQSAVRLNIRDEVMTLSANGRDLPLEKGVLEHVRHSGRIFQFKSRCVFNYGRVTLMVNNMPVEDEERCGRIRDNAALLAEGADARLRAIEVARLAEEQREGIESALPYVGETLDALQENYRRTCFNLTQVMIEFQEAQLKSFMHLGLTEAQEEHISSTSSAYMRRMVSTQDESLKVVEQLTRLGSMLNKLVEEE